jgi:hypothetical protein
MPDRPFAAQARALCPDLVHDDQTPCPMCERLEKRLQPVTEALSPFLVDAGLTVTVRRFDV